MLQEKTAAVEQGSSTNSRPTPPGRMMIDVEAVASKYGADKRSIFRWADSGRIPFGVKLSALRRWDLVEIDAHIAGGCKPARTVTGKAVCS
jgi:predicted DNA-binding transcriptional regulator AlpA